MVGECPENEGWAETGGFTAFLPKGCSWIGGGGGGGRRAEDSPDRGPSGGHTAGLLCPRLAPSEWLVQGLGERLKREASCSFERLRAERNDMCTVGRIKSRIQTMAV